MAEWCWGFRFYQHGLRSCLLKCCKSLFCGSTALWLDTAQIFTDTEENVIQRDSDVLKERERVMQLRVGDGEEATRSDEGQQHVLVANGISKIYPARGAAAQHTAVDDFYLCIPEVHCDH